MQKYFTYEGKIHAISIFYTWINLWSSIQKKRFIFFLKKRLTSLQTRLPLMPNNFPDIEHPEEIQDSCGLQKRKNSFKKEFRGSFQYTCNANLEQKNLTGKLSLVACFNYSLQTWTIYSLYISYHLQSLYNLLHHFLAFITLCWNEMAYNNDSNHITEHRWLRSFCQSFHS